MNSSATRTNWPVSVFDLISPLNSLPAHFAAIVSVFTLGSAEDETTKNVFLVEEQLNDDERPVAFENVHR